MFCGGLSNSPDSLMVSVHVALNAAEQPMPWPEIWVFQLLWKPFTRESEFDIVKG
jgi:hypothetical protein